MSKETLKAAWSKIVGVFDYLASWVASYPKIALGLILFLAAAKVFL